MQNDKRNVRSGSLFHFSPPREMRWRWESKNPFKKPHVALSCIVYDTKKNTKQQKPIMSIYEENWNKNIYIQIKITQRISTLSSVSFRRSGEVEEIFVGIPSRLWTFEFVGPGVSFIKVSKVVQRSGRSFFCDYDCSTTWCE